MGEKIETQDTLNTVAQLLRCQTHDFSDKIFDALNTQHQINWSTFSYHDLKNLYAKKDSLIVELGKKRKEIGYEQYIKKIRDIEDMYPTYQDVLNAKHTEVIHKYGYEIDENTKKSYLEQMGLNIQHGGSNAHGVFMIGADLVAIVKSEGSYVHELPAKTLTQELDNIRVPKVIDVFVSEGKTYKIMEKSPGIQLDRLTTSQIDAIPESHYDQLLADVKHIESVGLKIDPSKSSNFFYDKDMGFCFIDLGVKDSDSTWSMFDNIGNFNAHGCLDAVKLESAWHKK